MQVVDTACAALSDGTTSPDSTAALRQIAKDLARTEGSSLRVAFEDDDERTGAAVQTAWRRLGSSALAKDEEPSDDLLDFASAAAIFTRNLVAGSALLQNAGFGANVDLRNVLFACSSFSRMTDPKFSSLNALTTQALANSVTANDSLLDRFWPDLLRQEESQSLLCRLLSTTDDKLLVATCVLVLNCIHSNPARTRLFVTGKGGVKVLHAMLERMDTLLDDRESRAFEIITAVVEQVIGSDVTAEAYSALALPSLPLSPAQLCLLKVLDTQPLPVLASPSHVTFIVSTHRSLGDRILRLNRKNGRGVEAEPGDAKVWHGWVLVCGVLERVVAGGKEGKGKGKEEVEVEEVWRGEEGDEVVKRCVRILLLAPSLFPPSPSPHPSSTPPSSRPRDPLSHLRISTLKLLSSYCFGDSPDAVRAQDLVREEGGLGGVLELTKVDEHAAFVREHALFLVRNLLMHNAKNRGMIEGMQLQRKWVIGEGGEVRELPM